MTVAELSLPQEWEEITPDWMTAALARDHPGAVVDTLTVALRDDGTNRRARLALTYSAGSGPATVFAKAVDPEHADLVALTSGLYHEPRLFTSGIALPLDHPAVYTALILQPRASLGSPRCEPQLHPASLPAPMPAPPARPGPVASVVAR